MCSLGIKPTTFALLTQCSTTEPQEHVYICVSEHFSFAEIIHPPHMCGISRCWLDSMITSGYLIITGVP